MNMSMNECKSRILEIWSELETNKNDGFYIAKLIRES